MAAALFYLQLCSKVMSDNKAIILDDLLIFCIYITCKDSAKSKDQNDPCYEKKVLTHQCLHEFQFWILLSISVVVFCFTWLSARPSSNFIHALVRPKRSIYVYQILKILRSHSSHIPTNVLWNMNAPGGNKICNCYLSRKVMVTVTRSQTLVSIIDSACQILS